MEIGKMENGEKRQGAGALQDASRLLFFQTKNGAGIASRPA
jgi:hypothetical protein